MVEAWLQVAAAAEASSTAVWLRSSTWGYPAVEAAHIWGVALLVGTAFAFDLRLLGVASRLPADALARFLLPCARVAFVLVVLSGLLLFAMQATTFARQPLFYVKMATVAVAVLNTSVFHRGVFRSVALWNYSPNTPGPAKAAAIVSLVCWTFALICGRWLAYV
jgi:hypothetical protein